MKSIYQVGDYNGKEKNKIAADLNNILSFWTEFHIQKLYSHMLISHEGVGAAEHVKTAIEEIGQIICPYCR